VIVMTAGKNARRAASAGRASGSMNLSDVLQGQVGLDVACLDRIYLNGYVPNLQVAGQVVQFLTGHLGNPIPSPALMERIGNRFRSDVARFVETVGVPTVRFGKGDRKADVMRPYLQAAERTNTAGVVAVGLAQEFQSVFTAYDRRKDGNSTAAMFSFAKADRRVSVFYFYLWDQEFGPGFIKVCSYFPYPMKIWINGHEWAKQQARQVGLGFTALSNGFASCEDPKRLQRICDRLSPTRIQRFVNRWLAYLPLPLTDADHRAGYWWECSMRQVEVSRTLVFNAPRHARAFFDALVHDNLGMGRPDEISLIFDRRIRSDTPTGFLTKVVTRGVDTTVNFFYRHSRIKEYLKDGRALRIETVVNSPTDLGVLRRLEHLPELISKARDANDRLLDAQRVGQGCVLASPAFERVALSSVNAEGRRAPALRFGDPRVMALVGAMSIAIHAATGFTNRSLRAQVAGLLGTDQYSVNQMGYDLGRLRLNGLIHRLEGTNTYVLSPEGQRVAIFYTRLQEQLLRPLLAADRPPAPAELRQALRTIDRHVQSYIHDARLGKAA